MFLQIWPLFNVTAENNWHRSASDAFVDSRASGFRVLPTGKGFMALFTEVANFQVDGIFL